MGDEAVIYINMRDAMLRLLRVVTTLNTWTFIK